jgi:hypothetical protein
MTRKVTNEGSITVADLEANRERVENNLLRATCERAAQAGMTLMAFIEARIFPLLNDDEQRETYLMMLRDAIKRQLSNRSKE